jgi:hypothetical protein
MLFKEISFWQKKRIEGKRRREIVGELERNIVGSRSREKYTLCSRK